MGKPIAQHWINSPGRKAARKCLPSSRLLVRLNVPLQSSNSITVPLLILHHEFAATDLNA